MNFLKSITLFVILCSVSNHSLAGWLDCTAERGGFYKNNERVLEGWPGIDFVLELEGDSVLFLRFHGWNMVCQDVTKIDVSRGEISIECEVEETNGWSLSINRVTGRFDITQNRLPIVDVASGTCRAIEKKF